MNEFIIALFDKNTDSIIKLPPVIGIEDDEEERRLENRNNFLNEAINDGTERTAFYYKDLSNGCSEPIEKAILVEKENLVLNEKRTLFKFASLEVNPILTKSVSIRGKKTETNCNFKMYESTFEGIFVLKVYYHEEDDKPTQPLEVEINFYPTTAFLELVTGKLPHLKPKNDGMPSKFKIQVEREDYREFLMTIFEKGIQLYLAELCKLNREQANRGNEPLILKRDRKNY